MAANRSACGEELRACPVQTGNPKGMNKMPLAPKPVRKGLDYFGLSP